MAGMIQIRNALQAWPEAGRRERWEASDTDRATSFLKELAAITAFISDQAVCEFAETVPRTLQRVARAFSADRCCLFFYSEQGGLINLFWEYADPGLNSLAPHASGLPRNSLSFLEMELERSGVARVDDIDEQPKMSPEERDFYRTHTMRSFVACRMGAGENRLGFLLLSRRRTGTWSFAEIHGLQILAPLLGAEINRRRVESRLEDAGKNLDALMENLDDVLFILDSAGRILHANAAALSCLGYGLRELRTRLFADLVPPIERNKALKWLGGRSQAPTSFFPLIGKDGEQTPIESRLSETRWSGQRVLLVVGRDITARMQALDGLKKHQARSMSIINALPDLILRLKRDGTILDSWNAGSEDQGPQGKMPLKNRLASALGPTIAEVLDSGKIRILENRLPGDGTTRVFECRLVPFDEDEVLALARDVSDQKVIEEMKSEFINQISHDLRTPLTTARLMVELIQGGGAEEEIREYWQILELELKRQNDLIRDLLTVSRLEKGRVDLNCVKLNMGVFLEDVISQLEPRCEERGIRLRHHIGFKGLEIAGDPSALERALVNLVENALKFSEAHTTIDVEASDQEGRLIIRIKDQGMGIEPEDLPHIFDRFFRSQRAVDRGTQGCGVGLYLVKTIIEAHQGAITVVSRPGKGAAFTVSLPIMEA